MDCYKNVSNIVIYNKYKWIGGNKDEKCISSLFYKDRKKYAMGTQKIPGHCK